MFHLFALAVPLGIFRYSVAVLSVLVVHLSVDLSVLPAYLTVQRNLWHSGFFAELVGFPRIVFFGSS